MLNANPYKDVDFIKDERITSITHTHMYPRPNSNDHGGDNLSTNEDRQDFYDTFVDQGAQHLAISGYRDSYPDLYPMEDYVLDVRGVINSPNAEHLGLGEHFNGIGSLLYSTSGMPGFPTLRYATNAIVKELKYPGAGGVLINHPRRSSTRTKNMTDYLTYSDYVLGVEIYNYRSHRSFGEKGWALSLWDEVLKQGIQCFGFFNPDQHDEHDNQTEARNILLVKEFTEEECLKAYKDGRFYGSIHNTDLTFEKLEINNGTLEVETNTGTEIRVVTNEGTHVYNSKDASHRLRGSEIFVRVEVDDKENILPEGHWWYQDYETIFSQPFMLKPFEKMDKKRKSVLL